MIEVPVGGINVVIRTYPKTETNVNRADNLSQLLYILLARMRQTSLAKAIS